MRGTWGRLMAGGMALCWAQGVMAACNPGGVTVSQISAPTIADWNPMVANDAESTNFNITLTRGASNPNNIDFATIYFTDPDSATSLRVGALSGFAGPVYTIKSGSSDIVFASGVTPSNPLRFDFASGNNQNQLAKSATFAVDGNNNASADYTSGTYTETLNYTVQCYKGNGANITSQGSVTGSLTINVTIPNRLSVITAGPQTINFGSFTTTAQSLAISLKSTGAINASLSTENGNQMVLTGAQTPVPANSTIPYSMAFDGQNVPANGASLNNLSRAGVGGGNKALVLTLPALPSGKLAGTYKDVITLTLSPGT